MEQRVFLLLLVLGMLSAVQGWTTTFCSGEPCPEYHVVQNYGEFEERQYNSSRWITTKVQSSSDIDLMAANQKLKSYCEGDNKAGANVPRDTWPVLITVTEGEEGTEQGVSLSWFVEDDTVLPEANDPSIVEEVRPAANVYVRVFTDRVSHANGKYYTEKLREALEQTAKTFEPNRFTGVGYTSPWAIYQHNEVWVNAVAA